MRMGYPIYFRLEATFFYKNLRASITKHSQQSTKVRARVSMESVLFFSVSFFIYPASNSERALFLWS